MYFLDFDEFQTWVLEISEADSYKVFTAGSWHINAKMYKFVLKIIKGIQFCVFLNISKNHAHAHWVEISEEVAFLEFFETKIVFCKQPSQD